MRAKLIRQRAISSGGHRVLTAAAGMAGQVDAAAAARRSFAALQRRTSRWPGSRTRCHSSTTADRKHYLEGFRRAGLDVIRGDCADSWSFNPAFCSPKGTARDHWD